MINPPSIYDFVTLVAARGGPCIEYGQLWRLAACWQETDSVKDL